MITWAKFFFRDRTWHFQGFTSHEAAVAEFEEFCVSENVISVVLALQHPPDRLPVRLVGMPAGRRVKRVKTTGELL